MPDDTTHETDNLIGQVFKLDLPLVQGHASCDHDLAARLSSLKQTFSTAPSSDGAICGLLLRAGCWEAAHNIAQDLHTKEGSYWHAIIHCMEPDIGNAGYWYRKLGAHAIYPDLAQKAVEVAQRFPGANLRIAPRWDVSAYLNLYEKAVQSPGTDLARAVQQIHEAEWRLLYTRCADR